MANKNTMRLRRAGFAGYGENRGVKVDTSLSNPERKSSRKVFKIRPVEMVKTEKDSEPNSVQKIKKGNKGKL